MPFSSLRDPVEIARATAAMEFAWQDLKEKLPPNADAEVERSRLASIVLLLAPLALDERDLTERAVKRAYYERG